MARTDVPVTGLYSVLRDLETLDAGIAAGHITNVHFIRTLVLGMTAKLDATIITINES